MELNGLTTTLTHFISTFQGGYSRLQPVVNGLLGGLAAIEIVLMGFWWALGGGENLTNVIKKFLFLGFWLWFTTSFQSNASDFVHSLVKAGLTAGGNPGAESLLLDPSQIAGMGLQATAPLAESLQGITYHIGDMLVFGLSYIAIMLSFVVMAIQVFLAVLEYYLLVTLVAILVPFGIMPQTKFLAEKAIGAVVGAGIKLMVLALLMAILQPLLSQVHFSGSEIKLNELWTVLATCLTYAYLTWHVPAGVAGALAGSPSLSAAAVAQNASAAMMGAAGGAGLVVGATRAAASAASGVASVGGHVLGTAAGGAEGAASAAARAGSPAGPGAKLLGAGRALGQAALGAAGGVARHLASPVVDSFRNGARDALNRSDMATATADGASAPSSAAGGAPPASSPSAEPALAPTPAWANRAKDDLRKPLSERPPAAPRP
jgi:type IV secretion system protein TrbL